jgi:protein-S-isoprenylcysteine O-methyltransferase Ste14
MFGMLIAIGLAMEHSIALIAAVMIFAVGMVIRVRSEERLLRDAFGQEFDGLCPARACRVAGYLLRRTIMRTG